MAELVSCADCAFSHESIDGKTLQCRINPPQATIVMAQGFGGQATPAVLTFYPEVNADLGCSKGVEGKRKTKIIN